MPDLATISSFFGAERDAATGTWHSNNKERIPENWYNRKTPYGLVDTAVETVAQYLQHPVLFGGNTGKGSFDTISVGSGGIKGGELEATTGNVLCLIYQAGVDNVPSSLSGVLELPLSVVGWVAGKLNPVFKDFGCPLKIV